MKTRTLRLTLAAAGVVLVAAGTGALLWHRPTPEERAAEPILQKHAAARGGLDAWKAVHALAMSGTLDAGVPRDPLKLAQHFQRSLTEMRAEARRASAQPAAPEKQVTLPFVMQLERPRRSRVEVKFRGDTAVQVYDGERGWKLRPYLGRREVEDFTPEELRVASQQTELDGPLLEALAHHERVALLGTEKVQGRDAYKLEVGRGRDARHVWIDAQTYLDVKVDGTRRLDGKLHPVYTEYRDFRPENGLMIPRVLETSVEGVRGSETIRIERVAVNPSLPRDAFSRPD
jgi:hypothetical protein